MKTLTLLFFVLISGLSAFGQASDMSEILKVCLLDFKEFKKSQNDVIEVYSTDSITTDLMRIDYPLLNIKQTITTHTVEIKVIEQRPDTVRIIFSQYGMDSDYTLILENMTWSISTSRIELIPREKEK